MKLSLNWLNELVKIDAAPHDYIAAMTMSGSKVETLDYLGAEIENVVVGRLLSVDPHPDASKLVICQVDIGKEEKLQIVTGANNVSAGDLVPVALDGSKLPGGVEIHTGKLRGVESQGMLCSHQELGLTEHDIPDAPEHGILLLNGDEYAGIELGQDIRTVLGFDDHIVDFEITPNRPDCLSVIGLARESAATYDQHYEPEMATVKGGAGSIADQLSVTVEDFEDCPRYTARLVKNVRIAPSPKWMRERLRAMGVRPINNIVDITNYVMLEYGQPRHAFDYACLEDKSIIVRRAKAGELLETLDDQPRKLDESMLVIADGNRAVAVAGVMGGANSEITETTRDVVFESANFKGVGVRLTARALGMRTEASGRFEKGLDPRNTLPALERACQLVELLGAGDVCDGIIDVDSTDKPARVLKLEPERINRFIGIDVSRETMVHYLENLGFIVNGDDITVPSWRMDVEQFADVAEEIARFYGYDKIPTTLYAGPVEYLRDKKLAFEDELHTLCTGLGFDEIQTYSFVNEKCFDRIRLPADSPLRKVMVITNPLSEEMRVMRTNAMPSMLEVLARNANVKNEAAKLFELCSLYFPVLDDNGNVDTHKAPTETVCLTLGAYGAGYDFFALKGAVEGIAAALKIRGLRYAANRENPSFHPGRCADVFVGDKLLGTIGQVHPLVAAEFDMPTDAYIAMLDEAVLMESATDLVLYQPLPRFPASTRDLAIVCDEATPAAALEDCIRAGAGELLEAVKLFDIYRGEQVPAGKKSVAYKLTLRNPERTLTDADSEGAVSAIIAGLEKIGASLRA
ncbi:MAG: phenylalanine--tRNA ligase subunit beta [Clostridia bacterium]|nr:phenylalanine--tRNA ligase subunit beta [Clostridia bacterium]